MAEIIEKKISEIYFEF